MANLHADAFHSAIQGPVTSQPPGLMQIQSQPRLVSAKFFEFWALMNANELSEPCIRMSKRRVQRTCEKVKSDESHLTTSRIAEMWYRREKTEIKENNKTLRRKRSHLSELGIIWNWNDIKFQCHAHGNEHAQKTLRSKVSHTFKKQNYWNTDPMEFSWERIWKWTTRKADGQY